MWSRRRDLDWYTRRGQFRAAFWRSMGYAVARAARELFSLIALGLVAWYVVVHLLRIHVRG